MGAGIILIRVCVTTLRLGPDRAQRVDGPNTAHRIDSKDVKPRGSVMAGHTF